MSTINSENGQEGYNAVFFKAQLNIKPKFIKASQWYLDSVKELELDIRYWKNESAKATQKDATSYYGKKHLQYAYKLESLRNGLINFLNLCESIIDQYEGEIWLKERLETAMLLQLAANRQGLTIDVHASISKVFRQNSNEEN